MAYPAMPYRLNPAYFTFALYDRGSLSELDPDFREPIGSRVYSEPINLKGQLVGYRGFNRMQRTQAGEMEQSRGSAVFKPRYLEEKGIKLQHGDRIIKINQEDVDFVLVHVTVLSPYRGRNLMLYIEFEQRRALRESI